MGRRQNENSRLVVVTSKGWKRYPGGQFSLTSGGRADIRPAGVKARTVATCTYCDAGSMIDLMYARSGRISNEAAAFKTEVHCFSVSLSVQDLLSDIGASGRATHSENASKVRRLENCSNLVSVLQSLAQRKSLDL